MSNNELDFDNSTGLDEIYNKTSKVINTIRSTNNEVASILNDYIGNNLNSLMYMRKDNIYKALKLEFRAVVIFILESNLDKTIKLIKKNIPDGYSKSNMTSVDNRSIILKAFGIKSKLDKDFNLIPKNN